MAQVIASQRWGVPAGAPARRHRARQERLAALPAPAGTGGSTASARLPGRGTAYQIAVLTAGNREHELRHRHDPGAPPGSSTGTSRQSWPGRELPGVHDPGGCPTPRPAAPGLPGLPASRPTSAATRTSTSWRTRRWTGPGTSWTPCAPSRRGPGRRSSTWAAAPASGSPGTPRRPPGSSAIEPDPAVPARRRGAGGRTCPAPRSWRARPSTPGCRMHSADVVHARFAYFFPPGTDAGLAEVLRILRPGGAAPRGRQRLPLGRVFRAAGRGLQQAAARGRGHRGPVVARTRRPAPRGPVRAAVPPPGRARRRAAHRVPGRRRGATGWPATRRLPA